MTVMTASQQTEERIRQRPTKRTIDRIEVSAYKVPTDRKEGDGTMTWDSTTLVLVEAGSEDQTGIGYTYADAATAVMIRDLLAEKVTGIGAMDIPAAWWEMIRAIRNLGRPGVSSMAIAAVDSALWDLKAKLLNISLVDLLGSQRETVPVYGSGGFTTYSNEELYNQLHGWASEGIKSVKMKVGAHPDRDEKRVSVARDAIGPDVNLYVDANGAYGRKDALEWAKTYREYGVVWFEEPVSSDDLAGLHLIRDQGPAGMHIAAGEYGYDVWYFRRMLEAEAVDVLQADASRCAGITGWLDVSPLVLSRSMPLSAHCAPTLHVAPCCAIPHLWPIEYFHDHVRIEHMLFDGVPKLVDGALLPDRSRPGMGIEFKHQDAQKYRIL